MKHLSATITLFVCALPSFAAQTYYMAPYGADNNAGTISAPWLTLAYASSQLKPGDTLYARGGTYTGQSSVSWGSPSGTSSEPITWKAYPGETPVFDGHDVDASFLSIVGTSWLTLDGITVKNYRGCCAAIWIGYSGSGTNYAENNVIRNMTITDIGQVNDQYHGSNTHGIYVSYGNRNLTITGNTILRVTGAGIHCYHDPGLSGGYIFNNVIDGQNIAAWGIVLRNTSNVELYNNTIINTRPYNSDGGSDIDDYGSTNVTIQNNILSLPVAEGATGTVCTNNLFTNDANGNESSPNCGTSNVAVPDAGFVNAAVNDYHLISTSPAVDQGVTISSVTVDKDGVLRPQGIAYDIGAYEYRSAQSSSVQLVAKHSSKCLQVIAGSTSAGVGLEQWTCDDTASQRWNLVPNTDGSFNVMSANSGMAMDVAGFSSANGARVIQWAYWGGANEKWKLVSASAGYYNFVPEHSGKCLDVRGGPKATQNGAIVDQWACLGSTNQEWTIVPVN